LKITKLYCTNFRTLKGFHELPLTDEKINLFVGETNGIGKSSWFFLVYYLLANYTSGKTIEDYVNWDSTEMSGGIDFEFKNLEFKVEMTYKNKKADKTLWIGTKQFDGVTACNKKLKEYFDPNLFIGATGLFQNARNFTAIKDSERMSNLMKVFSIDYTPEVKLLEKEEKDIQEKELSPKEKELIALKAKTFTVNQISELPFSEDVYNINKLLVEGYIKENSKLESTIQNNDKVVSDRISTNVAIKTKKDLIAYQTNSKNSIEKEIIQYKNFVSNTSTLDELKLKLDTIKFERIKAFDESDLNTKIQTLADNNAKKRTLEKTIQDCKSGKCPTCGEDFNSSKHELYETEILGINTTNETLTTEINSLKEEKKTYEEIVKQNESKKRDKELLESKIKNESSRLEEEIKTNSDKVVSKEKELESKIEIITQAETDLLQLEEKLKSLVEENIDSIKTLLENNKKEKAELESKNKTYDDTITRNKVVEENNIRLEKEKEENDILIKATEKVIDELIEKKDQINKMRLFLKKEFPSYVIDSMIEQIQDNMNEFISKVYYKDLDVEIKGSDDSIEVLYGTGARKVDTINASGAEESLLALAYCYALNKLQNYSILFMDEVDSSLKDEAAIKLAEMIDVIKEEYDFIGIVSHVKSVQDFYGTNGANIIEVDK